MRILNRERALELAERVVGLSPADETEVVVDSLADSFVRFAATGPTQSADRDRIDVRVRVRLDGDGGLREAGARCVGDDPATLERCVARAVELARASKPNPELLELGGACEVAATDADDETLAHTGASKVGWVGAALEACEAESLDPAGLAQTSVLSRALCNSRGRAVHGFQSRAALSLTASSAGGSGMANCVAPTAAGIAADDVAGRAVGKAVANREPRGVEPGEYTVVLEPLAVSSALLFASYAGFGAREVAEEGSFLCGRIGERIFPEELALADDAFDPLFPKLPFDGEGTPRTRVPLLEGGALRGFVTDRRWARERGTANTGHACLQPSAGGPRAESLVLAPGALPDAELVAGVERGLLVTQFHYTNLIEPRDLVLTGMTRNGTYLIEDGRVVGSVKNLRFTQGLVEALQNVTGVGSEQRVAGALFEGEAVLPSLRIDGFRFTSSSDF